MVMFTFQGMTPRFLPLVPGWMMDVTKKEIGERSEFGVGETLSSISGMVHLRHLWDEQRGRPDRS